jgi:hypothetical protein
MSQPQTLADLLALGGGGLPEGWDARAHALLLPAEVAAAVAAAQTPDMRHRIEPVAVEGWPPYGIGADVLTEASGLFLPVFQLLDRALAAEVLVVSWADFVSRLPPASDEIS